MVFFFREKFVERVVIESQNHSLAIRRAWLRFVRQSALSVTVSHCDFLNNSVRKHEGPSGRFLPICNVGVL
jgi:hypothetical protein